jgi:hypothetical protein
VVLRQRQPVPDVVALRVAEGVLPEGAEQVVLQLRIPKRMPVQRGRELVDRIGHPAERPRRPEPPEPKTGIAKLSNFTPSCATPFVVLFNPPGRDYNYYRVASKLAKHGELQDKLTFVEFQRDEVSYFGAQADDESVARALMEAYKANEPRAKPILGCLDAKSYVGDRYTVRWDAKIVLLNLSAGRWL